MLTEVSGTFVKIAFAADGDIHLSRGLPDRPAARFNRPGQDALYLSPDEESARVAIGEYVGKGDLQRVLLQFEIAACTLLDLRHPQAASLYALARQSWREALTRGEEPKSWHAADIIRESGPAGLIDPSRRRPGLWHITLMRWNEPDAPTVRRVGTSTPFLVEPGFR